jgi:hypothetical protein
MSEFRLPTHRTGEALSIPPPDVRRSIGPGIERANPNPEEDAMTQLKNNSTPLICDWRQVVGRDGRQRLEARWCPDRRAAAVTPQTMTLDLPAIDAVPVWFAVAQ